MRDSTISTLTIACTLAVIACGGSSTEPGSPLEKRLVTMQFCPDYAPSWVAHQDDGGAWTRVPVANGKASFQGTEKQAMAMAHTEFETSLSVIYTTSTTLEALACLDDYTFSPKIVKGTVTSLGNNYMTAVLGSASTGAYPGYPDFTFYGVPTGAQDLVATLTTDYTVPPDKMILRRGTTYADNASISLDFAAEGFALEQHTVNATGAGSFVSYSESFRSSTGAQHDLWYANTAGSLVFVPANKLVDGDLHEISALTTSFGAGYRGVMLYARNPGDKTLPFGPAASSPAITNISPNPLRLRAQASASADYSAGASIAYNQTTGQVYRSFEVTVLADHFDAAPSTWTMDMPDLSKVDGFQSTWQFTSASYEWSLQLIDGPIVEMISGHPSDGTVVRFAALSSSSASPMVAGAPAPAGDMRAQLRQMRPRLLAGRR